MTRLRRSKTNGKGYTRETGPRGVRYVTQRGRALPAAERKRCEALVIPPAWTEVWISPHPHGHIQATGLDEAGRRQYLYHPAWRLAKDSEKFDRMLQLAMAMPSARRRVTTDLRGDGTSQPTESQVLAAAFRLLDTVALRIGSAKYRDTNGSFGLSTLQVRHAALSGDDITLTFTAKGGKKSRVRVTDHDLALVLESLQRRRRTAGLLAYRDGKRWHPITATSVNGYIRTVTDGDFTAKDLRTLRGTVAVAVSLSKAGPAASAKEGKRAEKAAIEDGAAALGNTPAILAKSYLDPRVLEKYRSGVTLDASGHSSPVAALVELLR